jgi:hypothetical protein
MNSAPSPDEAAAIAAAVERFRAEASPAVDGAAAPAPGAWHRAALLEGVSARSAIEGPDGKGGARWLS